MSAAGLEAVRVAAASLARWRREIETFESLRLVERAYAARVGELTAQLQTAIAAIETQQGLLAQCANLFDDAAREARDIALAAQLDRLALIARRVVVAPDGCVALRTFAEGSAA
ncbi:MAG: hypothetical protein GC206_13275 [Alphaproteobacteria bacterium]|nr:hypothetical protein [Alphaproteobacteria bacterium]